MEEAEAQLPVAEPTLAPHAGHDGQPGAVAPAVPAAPAAPAVPAAPAAPAVAAAPAATPAWSIARRLGFRFVFVYLLIYNLPVAASWIPATGWLIARYQELWAAAVPWVGRHVIHLARPIAAVA